MRQHGERRLGARESRFVQSSSAYPGLLYKASLGRAGEQPGGHRRIVFVAVVIDVVPERQRDFSPRRYNRRRLKSSYTKENRMSSRVLSGVALAAAAAVMFSTVAVSTASADEGKVKCEGVNSCKGHSACKSANNACKGQNSCKGKGWMEMTQAQCDAAKAKAKSGS